jgi:hypothetical protein
MHGMDASSRETAPSGLPDASHVGGMGAASPAPEWQAWPNLFVVGAVKAGTTSLWAHLDASPEIFMTRLKEPTFFADRAPTGKQVVKDLAEYAELFVEGADRRYRGEASPSYLPDPHAAEKIRAVAPGARIIASLRDPVERAYANYWTTVRAGNERRTFGRAVGDELAADEVSMADVPPPYVARGLYADQLERWYAAFGGSVLVLFFEEFVADVRGTMRTVFEWLDVDPEPADHLDVSARFPFEVPRSPTTRRLIRVPGAQRIGRRLLPRKIRSTLRGAMMQQEKPPLDPETRRLLRDVYAEPDARLRELLGRPLPWDGR